MISVIVPVFNGSKFIESNYLCLKSQLLTDFEVIYVDDGSTDDSLTILQDLQQKDDRIRVFSQVNSGAIFARMFAVQHAKYDFVTFLDIDDTINPECLSEFKKYLSHGYDIVATGFTLLNSIKNTRKLKNNVTPNIYTRSEYLNAVLTRSSWELCAKVFNKKLFDNIMLPDRSISVAEDTFIFMQLIKRCDQNIIINDTYNYIYNYVDGSISRQKNIKYVEDALYVARELKLLLKDCADEVDLDCMVLLLYSNSLRRGMVSSHSSSFLVVKESFKLNSLIKIPFLKSIYVALMYLINRSFK